MSTSISDYTAFKQACLTADLNTFKRHPDIVPIFEHTSAEQGEAYLQIIRERYPSLIPAISRLSVNDAIGSANRCIDVEGLSVSPSTLRYVKVLGDLIYAGLASGDAIVEIGGGYGGQALVIRNKILWQSYTIFDLPEVQSLQERYLAEHDLNDVLFEVAGIPSPYYVEGERGSPWDFCISNYAFSECNKQMQDWYLEHVILKSKKGYMTCNFISSQFGVDSYSQEELLSFIPYSWLEAENPLTSPANVVIRW
jgi:putative sugar O-methyltransferase